MAEGFDRKSYDNRNQRMPHRAKKDTKRWCRGKPGIEHDCELKVPDNMTSWRHLCRYFTWYKTDGTKVERWICGHAWVCKNCNKTMSIWPKEDVCPDRPRDTGDRG